MEATAAVTQNTKTDLSQLFRHSRDGKIVIRAQHDTIGQIWLVLLALSAIAVLGFATFDYKEIDLAAALQSTFANARIVFFKPALTYDTALGCLYQLLVTFCLGALSTILGAVAALFLSLLCARNLSRPSVVNVTKAYAESIEEMDEGTIEALKASGANFWQIVCQAVWPATVSYMVAWTFMRFEINFTNAVAMGAAAGAGGIGYNLFMAGSFYLDLNEMGYLTYMIVIAVVLLEMLSTRIKAKVK
ncbi:MAG: ABC transporter permease subunit [Lachnospiraceae bacterium]|nr:ABC transporter permease subunit [Lachnospiraceae bacterium]